MIRRKPLPKKIKKVEIGKCEECKFATILQWMANPLITDCHKGRNVASMKGCEVFQPFVGEREIIHLLNGQLFENGKVVDK